MNGYLVVEGAQEDVLEVEFDSGLHTELPAAWLRGAREGDGFRVEVAQGGVRFVRDERAARFVRERNKQTLLDFADEVE